MAKEKTPAEYLLKRKTLMLQKGIRPTDLMIRWKCARSMASEVVNGNVRSYEKEKDLAELLGVRHSTIYPKTTSVRSRSVVQA